MQNETAHGREGSQSRNLCKGPVCPSRIRLVCLEIHLDQSLGSRIIVSDGQTASELQGQDPLTECHTQRPIKHTPQQVAYMEIQLPNTLICEVL